MDRLHSYDIHMPLVNRRLEKLFVRHDPLGFRPDFKYEFELEVMDILSIETQVFVLAGKKVIKNGPGEMDYSKLGDSRAKIIKEAEILMQDFEGASLDVVVRSTLSTRAAIFDDYKKPFYGGAVRCFHTGTFWRRQEDESPLHVEDREFIIWKNGAETEEGEALNEIVLAALVEDLGAERRKGPRAA
jgi:hypothetical protein